MSDEPSTGPGAADAWSPLFFVSYAHTPSHTGAAGLDPDKLVETFFHDLRERVAAESGLSPHGPVGFIDRAAEGDGPDDPLARAGEALATCRVFVPLCSPRYFASERCGREWAGFAARAPVGGVLPIVRVSWAPVPLGSLPTAARDARPDDSAMSESYLSDGLYVLLTLEKHDDYRRTVAELARQVAAAARLAYPAAHAPVDLDRTPNAFSLPPRPPLRIILLAPTTARLPHGRDAVFYGTSPLDWDPYRSLSGHLADDLVGLARNLDFAPEVVAFDDVYESLLAEVRPAAPAVLVVDVWALDDAAWRERLREFDRLDRSWISVLAVMNRRDPETDRHAEHLTRLLRDTLSRRNTGGRIGSRVAARGAQSMEELSRSFSAMAETAGMQYLMHSRGRQGGEGGTGPGGSR